jgi:hypothetical protein
MADRAIKLTREVTAYVAGTIQGTRIKITAAAACGDMPTKIFRYREVPLNPNESTKVGAFDGVCSPADLEDMPEDTPTVNSDPSWFRLDYVDLVLRSRAEVEDLWASLYEEVGELKVTLDLLDTFETGSEFWIGNESVCSVTPSALSAAVTVLGPVIGIL